MLQESSGCIRNHNYSLSSFSFSSSGASGPCPCATPETLRESPVRPILCWLEFNLARVFPGSFPANSYLYITAGHFAPAGVIARMQRVCRRELGVAPPTAGPRRCSLPAWPLLRYRCYATKSMYLTLGAVQGPCTAGWPDCMVPNARTAAAALPHRCARVMGYITGIDLTLNLNSCGQLPSHAASWQPRAGEWFPHLFHMPPAYLPVCMWN